MRASESGAWTLEECGEFGFCVGIMQPRNLMDFWKFKARISDSINLIISWPFTREATQHSEMAHGERT